MMRVVRFIDRVCNRELQLMRPQPTDLVTRRQAVTASDIEKNVGGLRDQYVAILQKRWSEGKVFGGRLGLQPLHRVNAAAVAGHIDVFGTGLLQGEAYEFAAPLDRRQVVEFICYGN